MQTLHRAIIAIAIGVFFIGAGFIVYKGRPVEQIRQAEKTQQEANDEVVSGDESENGADEVEGDNAAVQGDEQTASGVYTMADITAHAKPESCWAAINDSVYDLTTWVARHPGGEKPISMLCGKDATDMFTRKHGKSKAAQSALGLLKIGSLN
jgi:cytochrome b involved in lipid metabolism